MLRDFRAICADAPDELTVWAVLRKAPPLPFLPEDWHGREVLIFAACYAGDMAKGEAAMKGLRALGKPIADVISPHPFTGWQAAFDPLLTPGARNYWKSHDFIESVRSGDRRSSLMASPTFPIRPARCSSPISEARWHG